MHAELPEGRDPREGGGRRASAPTGRRWISLWSAIRMQPRRDGRGDAMRNCPWVPQMEIFA
eukprot:7471461-Pyramimonas_sp.AAC.1